MLTDLQKRAAQAIVNVFETGRARGDYGQVTLLAGDTGHLTYGRAQTTLASGNLFLLVKAYAEAPQAALAGDLEPFLDRLAARDLRLDHHLTFRDLLRRAGRDPIMHDVQDNFFDRVYWQPSLREAERNDLTEPLCVGVVYDSRIHGSWGRMRDRTIDRFGTAADAGQRTWIGHYLAVRREWLSTHANELLHRTVYRMDALLALLQAQEWLLDLPLTVRGVVLDEETLIRDEPEAQRASAGAGARLLRLASPRQQGDDVRAVQQALAEGGFDVAVSGTFSRHTADAARAFQRQAGLTVDGIVGPATRAALGLDEIPDSEER